MTIDGPTAVLLISCPDQKGLLAEVSSFIYRHGGNIVYAEQHIDRPQDVLERQVLGRGVRLHLLNRVLPYGRKTVVFV